MSALLYGVLSREPVKASLLKDSPNVTRYLDILTGLVPGDVLVLHAVILSFTTEIVTINDVEVTQFTANGAEALKWAFFGLIVLSIFLYWVPKIIKHEKWDGWDFGRMFIPPVAFIAWTMLQRMTAFDAIAPGLETEPRTLIAIFTAIVLSIITTFVSIKLYPINPYLTIHPQDSELAGE